MVLANQYRHPVLTAKMVATLDVISGGRITLGIGAGGSRSDTEHSGLPFPSTRVRCEMLEESLTIIRRLWTEPFVDYDGKHYRVSGASIDPKPTQRPAPPILVGGHGPRYVLPMIGRTADMANVGSNDTVDEHRRYAGIIRQAAEDAGRDPAGIELTHNADCIIAPTQWEYERLVPVTHCRGKEAGMTATAYQAERLRNITPFRAHAEYTPERRSGCATRIRRSDYRWHQFGIRYFFVVFPNPAPSETLALFASEVMGRFE